ncbi:MAG: septal ring lytic transglycosylase RlpA family protein [Desulfovibrio sp.]|nr:septal ring lytic transglycosylase RlpA family protein [Desulfovibrio sp.]
MQRIFLTALTALFGLSLLALPAQARSHAHDLVQADSTLFADSGRHRTAKGSHVKVTTQAKARHHGEAKHPAEAKHHGEAKHHTEAKHHGDHHASHHHGEPAHRERTGEHALQHVGDVQHCRAAWYGAEHSQKRTSDGGYFDHNAMTAAHRTLPFGSVVKVTNMRTDKTVNVRVTDRGPTSRKLCIDISSGAAHKIGMYHEGIGNVRLELVKR